MAPAALPWHRLGAGPGIEPLTRAAAALQPDTVTGFIEAVLVDWNHEFESDSSLPIWLDLPADKAQAFGFITGPEKLEAMAAARRATQRHMDDVISEFKDHGLGEERLQLLREARSSIREFRAFARQFDKRIAAKSPRPGPRGAGQVPRWPTPSSTAPQPAWWSASPLRPIGDPVCSSSTRSTKPGSSRSAATAAACDTHRYIKLLTLLKSGPRSEHHSPRIPDVPRTTPVRPPDRGDLA
ncbi:hypothetical protein GCM10009760_55610 [Kitasatospora kazusensis]|uniref:Uncharacterized protein n=1 Tax=Kitasatospora kazusensis TaxID=407974 RepID=A0ABN3A7T8_9ACTN